MSELLSILFAAIFASSMGLNHAAAGNTKAEQSDGNMRPGNDRLDSRQAKKTAQSVYMTTLVGCRKKPSAEKKVCLEEARALNAKTIVATQQTATIATASSAGQ